MNPKHDSLYVVKMNKKCDYMLNYAGLKKCKKVRDELNMLRHCDGQLSRRPMWCPLREVDVMDIAGKQFHVRSR